MRKGKAATKYEGSVKFRGSMCFLRGVANKVASTGKNMREITPQKVHDIEPL